MLQRENRWRDAGRFGKRETGRRVLDDVFDLGQTRQRLDPGLRLARFAGLVTEAVDETLNMRPLRRDPFHRARLLHGFLGADPHELIEPAGRQRYFAAVEMRDRLDRAVEQAAVMRHHQRGTGEAGEPALQPQGRLQVEVVGWFIQQQQIGVGEQRGGQRHAHPPAAGKRRHRACLRRVIEAQSGEDRGGAGGRGVGTDGTQPLMDFSEPERVSAFHLGQQTEALGIAVQHGIQEAGGTVRRFLPDGRDTGAAGEPHLTAVERDIAHDGAQQGGFAGAVAAHEADAPARVDREIGPVQQSTSAQADDGTGNNQDRHGGRDTESAME